MKHGIGDDAGDFARYLAAKRTVDDRALNGHVWDTLRALWPAGPARLLEIGAGTGAMMERLARRGVLEKVSYTALDAEPANVAAARRMLAAIGMPREPEWVVADVYEYAARQRGRREWDLLVAHAFLDLVDIDTLLPDLFALLRPGGLFYFTINFDGLTAFEPEIDRAFDERIVRLYHRTMDERLVDGRASGHSQTGRQLLSRIPEAGGEILAAGSSDWVVWPQNGRYPADERYFLHFILKTIGDALSGHRELDQQQLAGWLAHRRAQVEAAELIYIAHQLDIAGRVPG